MKNESIMFGPLRRFVCYYVVQRNVYSTFVSYWRSYHRDVFARLKRGSGMREILFRAKGQTSDRWYEGLLTRLGQDVCRIKDNRHKVWICDSETVCQYTGLTDRNSRKIFEGDIVRDIFNDSVVGIVRYGEYRNTFNDDEHGGHVGFYVDWKEKQDLSRKDLVYWVKNSEFIGNVFDNPELCE